MKKNNKSLKISAAIFVSISFAFLSIANCTKSGAKKDENPTALLYIVNSGASANVIQNECLAAYTAANSCVSGREFFNAGTGCAATKLDGKTLDDYKALRECVLKKVNDTVQPCNLPQFRYALAQQALAGAFADCNKKFTTAAQTEVDLKDYLVF
ncbi:MAG: hypothetical protein O9301_14665 [Leptospira sp.]|nr:hypothetical protein [Leptospira sp.]